MFNILAASHQGFFFPKQASTIAPTVDQTHWFINAVMVFFAILIFVMTVWFAFRYRKSKHPTPAPAGHNNLLEVGWTVAPALILLVMFFMGFRGYMELAVPPTAAHDVQVNGKMWVWTFEYKSPEDGTPIQDPALYLPLGEPVVFTMTSSDVIHSLFLPAFRVKKDVVPGRFNKLWVTATQISRPFPEGFDPNAPFDAATANALGVFKNESGKFVDADGNPLGGFDVYCTEYCGINHSTMLTKAYVLPPNEYRAKLIELSDPSKGGRIPPAEVGAIMYKNKGCITCHSVDGSRGTGPTWKDLYGKTGRFTTGESYVADENYIAESIYYPNRHLVEGFGGGGMPSYLGQVNEKELGWIIEYMKSISEHYKGLTLGTPGSTTTPATTDAPQ